MFALDKERKRLIKELTELSSYEEKERKKLD